MIHSILADKGTRLYIVLGAFFVANALIAEMIGVTADALATWNKLAMPKAQASAKVNSSSCERAKNFVVFGSR